MSGWRYSAQVPDFTREERQGEEIIVYYQVDVLVQAPGAATPAPPTTVWRRFSEFRQLHSNLKGAYPELFKAKELEPPSKRSLRFVNNNDRLLHQRRKELEAWLWKLLAHGEIAHSRYMKVFLQLNLAVRGATTAGSAALSQKDGQEDIDDEQLDTGSEVSAPSGVTNLSQPITDILTPGTAKFSTRTDSVDAYRMGLPVRKRREIKRLVHVISSSIDNASREVQEVRGENRNLQQENTALEKKVASLNQIIKEGKYNEDEQNEELRKTIEERDSALKKTNETVLRLEASLSEAQRQQEALAAEMRSVRQESATALEKHLADAAVMESKSDAQAVAYAKLEQTLQETKNKARQDNRLLAESVRSLKHENTKQAERLTQQTEDLKQIEILQKQLSQAKQNVHDLTERFQALQHSSKTLEQCVEENTKAASDKEAVMRKEHSEAIDALKRIIANLESEKEDANKAEKTWVAEKATLETRLLELQESASFNDRSVRLVLNLNGAQSSSIGLQEEVDELRKANAELKEAAENRSADESERESVSNLDDLMLTIRQPQEQNAKLQKEMAERQEDVRSDGLEHFALWMEGLYRDLHNVAIPSGLTTVRLSPDDANAVIEKIADCNGKLQLLTAKIEDAKQAFQKEEGVPSPLLTSVTSLLSDFVQKCNEMNEMRIDALLSQSISLEKEMATEVTSNSEEIAKQPTTPLPDSATVTDDGTQGTTPSMRMFLGGISARMTQGSQGFMNFMQRGNTVPMPTEEQLANVPLVDRRPEQR